jgi:hypothetical protein
MSVQETSTTVMLMLPALTLRAASTVLAMKGSKEMEWIALLLAVAMV